MADRGAYDEYVAGEEAYIQKLRDMASQYRKAAIPNDQNTGFGGDIITDIKRGVQSLPGAATGLVDIPVAAVTGENYVSQIADYLGETTGFQPGKWAEEAQAEYSPHRQAQIKAAEQAEGFWETLGHYGTNPLHALGIAAESLPSMVAGGAIGKGLTMLRAGLSPVVAAGLGEGAVAAGQQMESLTQQGVAPTSAALASIATGGATAGLGMAGASLARRMGVADPEAAIAAWTRAGGDEAAARAAMIPQGTVEAGVEAAGASLMQRMTSRGMRMAGGAAAEGVFEELPQSAVEQMIANVATGQDLTAGVGEAAAAGLVAGAAMGAGANVLGRGPQPQGTLPPRTQTEVEEALLEVAPEKVGTPEGNQLIMDVMEENPENLQKAFTDRIGQREEAAQQQAVDTARVAAERRNQQAMGFVSMLDDLISVKGNGVGPAAAERLQGVADAVAAGQPVSKEEIDEKLKGMRKSVQDQIRASQLYQDAPDTLQQAQEQAQEPVEPVTPEEAGTAGAPVQPAAYEDPDLDEEQLAEITRLMDEGGLSEFLQTEEQDKGTREATVIDVTNETAAVDSAGAPQKSALDEGALRALAGLINRYTEGKRQDLTAIAEKRESLGILDAKRLLKKRLPQIFTVKGNVRAQLRGKPMPAEIKRFMDALMAVSATTPVKPQVRSALTRRAAQLAERYNVDGIRSAVNTVVYHYKLRQNAKAPSSTSKRIAQTQQRLGGTPAERGRLQAIFDSFHEKANRYDKFLYAFLKDREMEPDFNLDLIAELASLEAKQEQGEAMTEAEKKRLSQLHREYAAAEIVAEDAVGGFDEEEIPGLKGVAQELTDAFRELEETFGRNNLLKAMTFSKDVISRAGPAEANAQRKAGQETKEAIRWSMLYSNFRENGFITPMISDNPLRHTKEVAKRLYSKNDPDAFVTLRGNGAIEAPPGNIPSKAEMLIREQRRKHATSVMKRRAGVTHKELTNKDKAVRQAAEKKLDDAIAQAVADGTYPVEPPLVSLLNALYPQMSPMTRLLASHLKSILQQSEQRMQEARGTGEEGRGFDDFISKIDLVLHNKAWGEGSRGGRLAGRYTPPTNANMPGTLELWQQGASPQTILHEVIHAVTVGMVQHPTNQNQINLIGDLMLLRADMVEALQDEEGLQANNPYVYNLLQIIADKKHGIDEFLTYGLTDERFQQWMKSRRTPAGYNERARQRMEAWNKKHPDDKKSAWFFTGKNWWRIFATKVRALLGLSGSPTEAFTEFLNASSGLLSEAYVESEKGNEAFIYRRRRGQTGTPQFESIEINEAKAAEVEAKVRKRKADTGAYDRARKAAQAEAERLLREEQRAEAEIEVAKRRAAEGRTVVQPAENKKDWTRLDALERQLANGVMGFVTGGRYTNWEEGMKRLWEMSGSKVKALTAGPLPDTNPVNRTINNASNLLGRVLASTVDQYGTPEAFRNIRGDLEAMSRGVVERSYLAYEDLMNLSVDQQQGVLDYIANRDEAQLKKTIEDETKIKHVMRVVNELDTLYLQAQRMGLAPESKRGEERLTLRDFIDLTGSSTFQLVYRGDLTAVKPANFKDNVLQSDPIAYDMLIGTDGLPVEGPQHGQKYLRAGDNEGNELWFAEGTPEKIWNTYNATLLDARPYDFVRSNMNSEYILRRHKTIAEVQKELVRKYKDTSAFDGNPKKRAHAISSLTYLMQQWTRSVQGAENIDNLITINDDLPVDQKWIVDDGEFEQTLAPEIPANRIFNLTIKEIEKSPRIRQRLRTPGTWARLPGGPEATKKEQDVARRMFGNLAGKYVSGPVYMALRDYMYDEPIIQSKTWRAAMTFWKMNKTVFSPVAHVNNVMGNLTLAYYYDIPASNLAKAARVIMHETFANVATAQKILGKNPLTSEERQLLEEMRDVGITLGQAKSADFDVESSQAIADFLSEKAGDIRSLAKLTTILEKAFSLSGTLYSNQDNMFRLAKYMTELQDSGKMGAGGQVEADAKRAAARAAEQAFVDYRIHAPWIKGARESVLPFIAWPYRMVPMMMKVAITKPWKIANTIMAVHTLNALAYSMLGMDDDEEEYERSIMPEWYKDSMWNLPGMPGATIRLPFSSEQGDAYFLNLSRTVPLADIGAVQGSGIPGVLSPGGPGVLFVNFMSNYDPFTGKELSSETDSTGEAAAKRIAFLMRGLGPGIATSTATAIDKSMKTGPLGYDYDFWVNAGKLMGISTIQMNVPEAAYMQGVKAKQVERAFKQEMGRRWRYELRYKDPDYENAYYDQLALQERMNGRMQEIMGE